MPVTPREILDSAVALGRGKAEVDWRNACSRAYYAGFHRCRQIANALEPHADTAGPEAGFARSLGVVICQTSAVDRMVGGWIPVGLSGEFFVPINLPADHVAD